MLKKIGSWVVFWGAILLLISIPTLISWQGCTKAHRHAPALGVPVEYVDLLPGPRSLFGCGKEGEFFFSRAFEDEKGHGVICCGLFKACTLRR